MLPTRVSPGYAAKRVSLPRIAQIVLVLLSALAPYTLAQKAIWCAKPAGLLERDYAYSENASAIKFAESIASDQNKTFLFVSKTSIKSQARAAAGSMLPLAKMMDNKSKVVPEMTAEEIEAEMKDPALQPSLNKLIDAFKDSKPEPNWFFYSNSPRFSDYFEKDKRMLLEKPGKGALLLMDAAGEKIALNRAVADAAKYLQVGMVFVEGTTPMDIVVPGEPSVRPLVLNFRSSGNADQARISRGLSAISQLQNATPATTTILFMMPETTEEAKSWGFGDEKAGQYVTNGQRILKDLAHFGYSGSIVRGKNKQAFLDTIKAAADANKSVIVVVGESGEQGGVRVPGSSDLLAPPDLPASMGSTVLLGLVCNSQGLLTDTPGLGIMGTVYTDQVRAIARVLLDRRPPDSSEEYFDVPHARPTKESARAVDAVVSITQYMRVPSTTGSDLPVLYVATPVAQPVVASGAGTAAGSSQSGGSPQNDGKPNDDGPPTIFVFLAGMVGAMGREIIRWRRLSGRKRADLYRKSKYIAISAIQVLLGGALALIFGQTVSGSWVYVIGFVSGAGLEEIVRRAMKLKVWTPSVAHGPGEEPDSALEYLRA